MGKREGGRWEPWEGGRVWIDVDGRRTYYIRKRIGGKDGKRYEVRTPATVASVAFEHLKRFLADPEGYNPAGATPREGLYLDDDLVKEHLAYSEAAGNSVGWRRKQKNILAWWGERLEGIDLRKVSLHDHVLPPLKRATTRHHRIAILKGLFTWLRTEVHRVTTAEDPVFGQLKVPQARAAQLTRSKLVPRDHVLLVIEQLRAEEEERRAAREARKVLPLKKEPRDAPWSAALTLQAGTGWHTTEVQRFAAEGSIEPLPKHAAQEGVAGVIVCPMRKSGEPQRTRVGPEVLEAAKRLRAHGGFSREWYDRAVVAACATVKRPDGEAGIPAFTPGRLRHSVASWAIDAGADPAQVAAFLGHRSPRTTRKFYATHSAPTKVPTLV
jgi:integrase